jgi:hypothetical protein
METTVFEYYAVWFKLHPPGQTTPWDTQYRLATLFPAVNGPLAGGPGLEEIALF